EGSAHADRLVGSNAVEELSVGLDFEAELVAVVDLLAVEVLVLQGAEGALADAVLVRALAPGADVDQLGPFVDVGGEADRLEAGPVVVDNGDRPDLTGGRADEQLGERSTGQPLGLLDRLLDGLDRVAMVLRGRDVPAELELRPVVSDTADPPDAAVAGL